MRAVMMFRMSLHAKSLCENKNEAARPGMPLTDGHSDQD